MVAEPRPRGMDVSLEKAATTGTDNNTTVATTITPKAAVRTLGLPISLNLSKRPPDLREHRSGARIRQSWWVRVVAFVASRRRTWTRKSPPRRNVKTR